MSELCGNETYAPQKFSSLFDRTVDVAKQRGGHFQIRALSSETSGNNWKRREPTKVFDHFPPTPFLL